MNQNILVIDTHPVFIHKTEGFLRGLTFQNIDLAKNSSEATKLLETRSYDLVILSGVLSDGSSEEMCAFIKRKFAQTKILVQISMLVEEEKMYTFQALGADAVLARKEKDLLPLQTAIEQLLNLESAVPVQFA